VRLLLLGMNHRSAPLELRERLAVEDVVPPLQKLVAADEIDEAVLFSTCNRVEVVVLTRQLDAARHRLRALFRRDLGGDRALPDGRELDAHLYEHLDGEAMSHVLRVASSLDSMVVGEPQILGQTKEAYRQAAECGACGPILGRLFQHALATAKRVRNETRIAERPVSVASVAVELAGQIFEDLEDKQALLIGAGEMIELALAKLQSAGLGSVAVANRTPERAALLAAQLGATAHGLDEVPALLGESDMVLTCIAGHEPILSHAMVAPAMRDRPHRPLFVIDIGVPRNVDPQVERIDPVYLYDIDDLGALASENAARRRAETARAEAIVAEQRQRFDGWFAALRAVPTIKHLRARAEAIRSGELERVLPRLSLSEAQRDAVDALTEAIVKKLLHAPLSRLRREAEGEAGMAYLEAARALFDLDDEEAPPGPSRPTPDTSDPSDDA
jgi:glutamyl-tRNA reductase